MAWEVVGTPDEGPPPYATHYVSGYLVVGAVGSALPFCAVLLYVPDGIQRA
jgi:hypothetical protein